MSTGKINELCESHMAYIQTLERVASCAEQLRKLERERYETNVKYSMEMMTKPQWKLHGRIMLPKIEKSQNELDFAIEALNKGPDGEDPAVIQDLLRLSNVKVEIETIKEWDLKKKEEAARWAATVQVHAEDSSVEVPDKPEFLP